MEIEEKGLDEVIAAADLNTGNMAAIAEENLTSAVEEISKLPEDRRRSEMKKLERQKHRRGSLASLALPKEERKQLQAQGAERGKKRRQSIFEQFGLVGASAVQAVTANVAPKGGHEVETKEAKERHPRNSSPRRMSTITVERTHSSKSANNPIRSELPGVERCSALERTTKPMVNLRRVQCDLLECA